MMLLMGMKSSLTMYPIPPMMAKPMAHEVAIFLNSKLVGIYMRRLAFSKHQ